MAIDIKYFIDSLQSSTYSNKGLNSIFSSILYTSILLSIIILILILCIYPYKKNTPFRTIAKLMLYIFIACIFVLSFHNGIINDKCEKKYRDERLNEFTGGFNSNPIYQDDRITVNPNLQESEYGDDESEYEEEDAELSVDNMLNKLGV